MLLTNIYLHFLTIHIYVQASNILVGEKNKIIFRCIRATPDLSKYGEMFNKTKKGSLGISECIHVIQLAMRFNFKPIMKLNSLSFTTV